MQTFCRSKRGSPRAGSRRPGELVTAALATSLTMAITAGAVPALASTGVRDEPADARPLVAPAPTWDSPSSSAMNVGDVVAAPVDAPLPAQVGIRPGTQLWRPTACTANFIFASRERLAIGTAGHCVTTDDAVVLWTLNPSTSSPVLVRLGRILIDSDAFGRDFALVEIPPSLRDWVSPTIAEIGGPCGAWLGTGAHTVAHYGHGQPFGTGGTARVGAIPEDSVEWWDVLGTGAFSFLGAGNPGDSGSPVRLGSGEALGVLTSADLIRLPGVSAALRLYGTPMRRILDIARSWDLVESPLCPPDDMRGAGK